MLVLSRRQLDLRRPFVFCGTCSHTRLRNLFEVTAATVCRDNVQPPICNKCDLEFGTRVVVLVVRETFVQWLIVQGSQRPDRL